jgi:ribosome biogenesis GTPase
MSKRRLSKQQRSRIQQRQKQQLDEQAATNQQNIESTSDQRLAGVVTCHFGQQLEVELLQGPDKGKLFRCFQRSNLPPLVCGDRVLIAADSAVSATATNSTDTGVVVGKDERHSVFSRPNSSGQLKPVAANIDLILVVIAPRPQPFLNLLDRYLVAIENLQLTPLIVINKADLMDGESENVIDTVQSLYPQLGYDVHTVSAHDGSGLDHLKTALTDKTAAIVGQSGVGKSSLVNALSPAAQAQVGSLSANTEKGTHTTTAARLFHLDGFDLIDSPGIREFHLWHISPQQLLDGFVEFRPFLGQCKFRDCSHQTEPGCALREAVEKGEISAARLESYFHILTSLEQD